MINPLGDILADSGYGHRDADAWALPLRAGLSPGWPGTGSQRDRRLSGVRSCVNL